MAKTLSIVHDGQLTQDGALGALRIAAESATEALPDALAKCNSQDQREKVQAERDTVVLAYLNSLKKSLLQTSSLFEKMAEDLQREAEEVKQKAKSLTDAVAAVNLLTELVRLAASLALAFG